MQVKFIPSFLMTHRYAGRGTIEATTVTATLTGRRLWPLGKRLAVIIPVFVALLFVNVFLGLACILLLQTLVCRSRVSDVIPLTMIAGAKKLKRRRAQFRIVAANGESETKVVIETNDVDRLVKQLQTDNDSEYISGKSVAQDNYKCKSCGFVAFGEEPARAKYKKCLGCGNIMGDTSRENKKTVYNASTIKDDERKEPSEEKTKKTLLVTCESCSHKFSKRAETCPKCGWKPTVICQICQQKIPFDSTTCPECGDPSPFELQEKKNKKISSITL